MRYLFDDVVVDVDCRELRRSDQPVAVEPQVFDLLVYLIRNRDRVVSKDDLLASVWQGRVVSDSALNTRINAVRTAIGDNGRDQRLVKTLPRKGFRFQGAVHEEPTPTATRAVHPAASPVTYGRPDRSQESGDAGAGTAGIGGDQQAALRDATQAKVAPDGAATLSRAEGEGWQAHASRLLRTARARIVLAVCALVTTAALIASGSQLLRTPTAVKGAGVCGPSSKKLATTITVMPFTALEPTHRAVAEKMGDDVRGYLSHISSLRVTAREAIGDAALAGGGPARSSDSPHYAVVGGVDEQDGSLQLRVELIHTSEGLQIWSQRSEFAMADWQQRQDEVARHIAHVVHIEAIRRDGAGLNGRVEDLSLRQLLASGRAILMGTGVPWLERAALVFDEALRRDPDCIPAMVGLAGSRILAATNLKGDRDRQKAEAEGLLRKALRREASDFAAYFYLGILQNLEGNIPAALQAYDQAIELNPSFAPAHAYRGRVLIRGAKYEEALQSIDYANRLAGPVVHGWQLWRGIAALELGRDNAAEDAFNRALAVLPRNPYVQAAVAGFRALKGEREVAGVHANELRRLTPGMTDQMRLIEFNKGADNQQLPNRLGAGLRQALEEQPEAPQSPLQSTADR